VSQSLDNSLADHLQLAGRLTLETAGSLAARVRRMRRLTIRIATGPSGAETMVYVAARVGGRRVWLLLDSGNGDPALVAPHVAAMAGLKGTEGDAVIQIDGVGPVQLPIRPKPIIYDGVLGAGFIQDWILTFDLASARAWAAPAESSKVRMITRQALVRHRLTQNLIAKYAQRERPRTLHARNHRCRLLAGSSFRPPRPEQNQPERSRCGVIPL
jgi:hypothetical protein